MNKIKNTPKYFFHVALLIFCIIFVANLEGLIHLKNSIRSSREIKKIVSSNQKQAESLKLKSTEILTKMGMVIYKIEKVNAPQNIKQDLYKSQKYMHKYIKTVDDLANDMRLLNLNTFSSKKIFKEFEVDSIWGKYSQAIMRFRKQQYYYRSALEKYNEVLTFISEGDYPLINRTLSEGSAQALKIDEDFYESQDYIVTQIRKRAGGQIPSDLIKVERNKKKTKITIEMLEDIYGVCFYLVGQEAPYLKVDKKKYRIVNAYNITVCRETRTYRKGDKVVFVFEPIPTTTTSFSFIEGKSGEIGRRGFWNFFEVSLDVQ